MVVIMDVLTTVNQYLFHLGFPLIIMASGTVVISEVILVVTFPQPHRDGTKVVLAGG
jgi:hypothetical protein